MTLLLQHHLRHAGRCACPRSFNPFTAALPALGSRGPRRAVALRTRRLPVVRSADDDTKASASNSNPSTSSPATPAPPAEEQTNAQKILAGARALEGEDQPLQMSREVIEKMKYTVFGLDTLFVTSVENYEADGVVFKGNLRAKDPGAAYLKMKARLREQLGDEYQMFLLEDVEGVPTAILLPAERLRDSEAAQGIRKIGEVWLAVVFAIATGVTTLQANGAPLFEFLSDPSIDTPLTPETVLDAVPGTLAFLFLIAAHEAGHLWGGWEHRSKLSWPLLVPAGFGFLGSFGGVNRIKEALPSRPELLKFALPGPLLGTSLSATMLMAGFILTGAGLGSVGIDSIAFADSLLIGLLGQLFIPIQLESPETLVHPLLLAGWGGLIVNGLHLIPAGDTDGSRIAHAVLGRRTGSLLSNLGIGALGISALFRPIALLWFILVLVLLRGPILPQEEEYSNVPEGPLQWGSLLLLLVPLVVLTPYPMELAVAMSDMQSPVPILN